MARRAYVMTDTGAAPDYLSRVVELYRRPWNMRGLPERTHVHEGTNVLCGDRLRVELAVRDEVIVDAAFRASACAIATASASLLTERVKGARVADIASISEADVVASLGDGVPSARLACATLSLRVLRAALASPA